VIALQDVRKTFDERVAVDGISLHVAPGEVYGLIGPNGAGKTTTLRMVAGLLKPTRGSISVAGMISDDEGVSLRARVGYATGTTGLYGRLTAEELLDYFGQLYRMDQARLDSRRQELARALGFEHLLGRRCDQLSTGERQRVSLARALLHDPPALVLDEPTAGLDVLASKFALDLVRGARASGRAVLFSTHYLTEAELVCDRIGLIHAGRLLCEGAPAAVKAQTGSPSLEAAFLKLIEGTA
jgi:sodium transport system ATP-binding protein